MSFLISMCLFTVFAKHISSTSSVPGPQKSISSLTGYLANNTNFSTISKYKQSKDYDDKPNKIQQQIIDEFYLNFPFLSKNDNMLNSTIQFSILPQGNYSGQIKTMPPIARRSDDINPSVTHDGKHKGNMLENGKLKTVSGNFVRHGWGKMTWKGGTLYGDEIYGRGPFIYGEGDEYVGHWREDKQNGKHKQDLQQS